MLCRWWEVRGVTNIVLVKAITCGRSFSVVGLCIEMYKFCNCVFQTQSCSFFVFVTNNPYITCIIFLL